MYTSRSKKKQDQTDERVCWPDIHIIDVNNEVKKMKIQSLSSKLTDI